MEHYIDKIEICNEAIFGDRLPRMIEMDFQDGYAISLSGDYGMSYPTLEEVRKTKWMQDEILAHCGNDRDGKSIFDIALKFGKFFALPANDRLQKTVAYLEGVLQPESKYEYYRFTKSLNRPEREYFLLYCDRTGDGGMRVDYLGVYDSTWWAFMKSSVPTHKCHEADIEREHLTDEVVLQVTTEIEKVYVSDDELSGELWAILSRPVNPNARFGVLVWNRHDNSPNVQNAFFVYDYLDEMEDFVKKQKVAEMSSHLELFNDSWFADILSGDYGLKSIENGINNVNIWANEGYNVHIINGTFK